MTVRPYPQPNWSQNPRPVFLTDSEGLPIGVDNPISIVVDGAGSQVNTFTAPGVGMAVDASKKGLSSYSLQVIGLGATPTSWDIRLEGSLDNLYWTPLLQHTESDANGSLITSGSSIMLCLYVRVNVVALAKGSATGVKVYMGYR